MKQLFLAIALLGTAACAEASLFGSDGLLEPEKAFRIAEGYYMYRDRFSFATESGRRLADVEIPRGKLKKDQFFGTTETFRHLVRMRVPISAGDAAKGTVTLRVISQGCSDRGVCYVPLEQSISVKLPKP